MSNGKGGRAQRIPQSSTQLQSTTATGTISLGDQIAPSQLRFPAFVERVQTSITNVWAWLQSRSKARSKSRKLRVCESAQLGEKRFVALVQADGQRFLIGGTSNSISLLATLPSRNKKFRDLLPSDIAAGVQE